MLSHNLFAYCENNPVNMKDEDGFRLGPAYGDAEMEIVKIIAVIAVPVTVIWTASKAASIVIKDAVKSVVSSIPHGNSKKSKKPQHGYEIYNVADGDVVKCGISGGKIRKDGKSYRAESQVRAFNKDPLDGNTYASRIVAYLPDRESALAWEETHSQLLWDSGNSMSKHKLPAPWK